MDLRFSLSEVSKDLILNMSKGMCRLSLEINSYFIIRRCSVHLCVHVRICILAHYYIML